MDDRRRDLALLLLRSTGVGLALAHGLGKVAGLAGGGTGFADGVARLGFPAPLLFAWGAGVVELVGGLLVAVGLATRLSALLGATVVGVAAFLRHQALGQLGVVVGFSAAPPEVVAGWGSPEKALLYLAVLLALALLGPGRWSLDHVLARRRRRGR